MSTDSTTAMRDFMLVVAAYATDGETTPPSPLSSSPAPSAEPLMEAGPNASVEPRLLAESRDLIFKLRAHTETGPNGENSNDDYALGVEQGFARAADMIEHLLRRYEKG